MRRLATVAVAATASLGALVAGAHADEGARLADAGWWYRASSPVPPLPVLGASPVDPLASPPPRADDGELVVASKGGEATAIAALRFELPPAGKATTLRLPVARTTGAGSVVACLSGSAWSSADGGAWADKPLADCEAGSATPSRRSDGAIEFAVDDLQVGTTVDLVLVPGAGADLEVVFARPRAADLTVGLVAPDVAPERDVMSLAPASPVTPDAGGPPAVALQPPELGRASTGVVARAEVPEARVVSTAASGSPPAIRNGTPRAVALAVAFAAAAYLGLRRRSTLAPEGPRGVAAFVAVRTGVPRRLR